MRNPSRSPNWICRLPNVARLTPVNPLTARFSSTTCPDPRTVVNPLNEQARLLRARANTTRTIMPCCFIFSLPFSSWRYDTIFPADLPIRQLTAGYRVCIKSGREANMLVTHRDAPATDGFLFAGDELVAQPAQGEQQLRVGRVGFQLGAQPAHQVFDLVVVDALLVLAPDGIADVVL